jgi:hypothetical protein
MITLRDLLSVVGIFILCAAVYYGGTAIAAMDPATKEFVRIIVYFAAGLLATGVLLVASAREPKL